MQSSPISGLSRLLKLDAEVRPGLSRAEFWAIFTACKCGLVTTRYAFHNHSKYCIVELTDSEEERRSDQGSDISMSALESESGSDADIVGSDVMVRL